MKPKFHPTYKSEVACYMSFDENGNHTFTAKAYSNPTMPDDECVKLAGGTLLDLTLQIKDLIDQWGVPYEKVSIYGEWQPGMLTDAEEDLWSIPLDDLGRRLSQDPTS